MDVYRKSFVFHATRYEEWMDGQCLNGDLLETDIVAEASDYDIQFYISNVGNLEINCSSSFEFEDESTELILDRIIYNHNTDFSKPKEPVECQLFKVISGISCIRFTLPSPLRVIEFYGNLTKVGSTVKKAKEEKIFNADIILCELKKYNKYSADEIMSIAVKEFDKCSEASSYEQTMSVVECLKLFVEVYTILNQEYKDTDEMPMLMSKVYFFIALCNYKIGNYQQAYVVAKAANPIIEQIISESLFVNLPREMLGGDDIDLLISHLENTCPGLEEKVRHNIIVNPAVVDTGIIESIVKNDKSFYKDNIEICDVESILSRLEHIEQSLLKLYEKTCNDRVLKAKIDIEKFKYPCYYALFYLTNNIHKDITSLIHSNRNFTTFVDDVSRYTKDYLNIIDKESPFSIILRHDDITNDIVSLYKRIIQILEKSPRAMSSFKDSIAGTNNLVMPKEDSPNTIYDITDFSEEISRIDSIVEIVNSDALANRENSRVPDILPEVLLFKSNEHQRYENGEPVMGLQHCQRTIQIEINKGDIEEYLVKPDDGFIVRVYNDDQGCAQMSAKPMRIHRQTDNVVELRGYPVQAMTPFGFWQPVDYSTYSFLVFFNNSEICQCAMCMLDRGVVIVYRYNNDNQIESK